MPPLTNDQQKLVDKMSVLSMVMADYVEIIGKPGGEKLIPEALRAVEYYYRNFLNPSLKGNKDF